MSKTISTVIKGTLGKNRSYKVIDSLPEVGSEFIPSKEYLDCPLTVDSLENVNEEVAETTSGNPRNEYDFYLLTAHYNEPLTSKEETYTEYVCYEHTYGINLTYWHEGSGYSHSEDIAIEHYQVEPKDWIESFLEDETDPDFDGVLCKVIDNQTGDVVDSYFKQLDEQED